MVGLGWGDIYNPLPGGFGERPETGYSRAGEEVCVCWGGGGRGLIFYMLFTKLPRML